MFLQEWNREIDSIRQDPERSAENLPEDRLYRGVIEALKLAQSAQRMRMFGGVRIVDVRDKAIRATAPARRPGASVVLGAGPGEESQTVVVALTKIEASRSFSHYFKALFDSSARSGRRCLADPSETRSRPGGEDADRLRGTPEGG